MPRGARLRSHSAAPTNIGRPDPASSTFTGFIGGENNQFYPELYVGTTPIEPERTPEEGYHPTEDLADKAIDYIRQRKALAPDKSFFVYFAPGATHAPHQVTKEWIAKYKGKLDQGWDKLREETFARQKGLGVIPPDCELTRRMRFLRGKRWTETMAGARPGNGNLRRVPRAC